MFLSIFQDYLGREVALLGLGEGRLVLTGILDLHLSVDVVESRSVKHLHVLGDVSSLCADKLSLGLVR